MYYIVFYIYYWSPVALAQLYKIENNNIALGGLHEEREESDPSGLRTERDDDDDDDWPCHVTLTSSAPPRQSSPPLLHLLLSNLLLRSNVPWEQAAPDCQGSELR